MAMKKDEMVVLGLAGIAVYMIVKTQGLNLNGILGTSVAGTRPTTGGTGSGGKTATSNPYSPWFNWAGSTPGYSLFDGLDNALGLASSPKGTGLGLKLDNTGLGMSYGGVESNLYGLSSGNSGYGISGGW